MDGNHPLVALMVECDSRQEMHAVRAIQGASISNDQVVEEAGEVEKMNVNVVEVSNEQQLDESAPERTVYIASDSSHQHPTFSENPMAVVKRISTPERLRQQTERLSVQVHELMDRHQKRVDRQREHRNSYSVGMRRNSKRTFSGLRKEPPTPELPDLRKTFEACTRAHLHAMRNNQSDFPSLNKPAVPLASDPSTFSLRFEGGLSKGSCNKNAE